ncbi:hypothetical protein F5876DRAFT_81238 [Lentinula aff. lateritia]|uniref:Uncharacterized protein n=1 Tax=Lentinula aff. lateritia TaxID=2804960 RepID=A0ACC1TMG7_9AGAR|nr:hypothetical protein F5876DRAFT_81238 [Lentinula aff. lateritia]
MSNLTILPNELLHYIVAFVAYIPEPPSCRHLEPFYQFTSAELSSLSLVNNVQDVKKLLEHCSAESLIPNTIRALSLGVFCTRTQEEQDLLCRVISHLCRLSFIHMKCPHPSIALLRTVLEQPSVSTVLLKSLHDLPEGSFNLDLSKLVLEHARFDHTSKLTRCLHRGSGISKLDVVGPELNRNFERRTFKGLQELNLLVGYNRISYAWLPTFTSAHPYLKKLWLVDNGKQYFSHHTPLFLSSFVQESVRRDLREHFDIHRVGLSRTTQLPLQWHVTGMFITATFGGTRLFEILSLISSSFPSIEVLSLDLHYYGDTYHIDDFVVALNSLSSLRILYIRNVLRQLQFGLKGHLQPVRKLDQNNPCAVYAAIAEADLLWCTSYIAKRMGELQAFYIDEMGYEHERSGTGGQWWLKGWIRVHDEARDVRGTLRVLLS